MKYIKYFSNVSSANEAGQNGMHSPHVDIVVDVDAVNMVQTNSEMFTCSFNSTTGLIENVTPVTQGHALGDIVYWDGSKLAYIAYASWQSSLGTPLGVCFIPTSHALVWGDGKARFLAVTGANADGSQSTSDQRLAWDGSFRDAGLTKRTVVPTWDNAVGGTIGSNSYGYISSDKFSDGTQNVIDGGSKYYSDADIFVPSPYAADGSFYDDYARVIEGNNALADFDGKANTAAIVNTLGNDGGEAAKACSLYSTNGIAAGEWYLPAAGELAYIMPRFSIINAALTACSGTALADSGSYWGSSEYGSNLAYLMNTGRGYVDGNHKSLDYFVRPVVSLS